MRHQHAGWSARLPSRARTLAYELLPFVALALLLSQLPLFQVRWLVWPDAEAALHRCHTAEVRVEHGISEGFVGYAGHPQGPLFLYSTTVVREVVCARATEELTLHYRDLYLNITHHDVASEVARLEVLYPRAQAYQAWRYDPHLPIFLLQHQSLDRYGFTLQPIELDPLVWTHSALYWALKLHAALLAALLLWLGRTVRARYTPNTALTLDSVDCATWA